MNKKTDYKNFRLQAALSRTANEIMTLHPVKKEWRIAILALLIVKLLTMAFSLFGGWNFFNVMFYGLFNDMDFNGLNVNTIINFFAIITLLSIELLTAVFLQKMFKFFYRHRFIPAFASALVVFFFYTVSFISSTNGLAERQAKKADQSEMITADFTSEKSNAAATLQNETDRINKQVARIEKNPQGWSEGKRTHLTAKQLADIEKLQTELKQAKEDHKTEIQAIEQKENTALAANTVETEKTAKDFYQIMAFIMAVQLIATGILNFFWYLIRSQESKDAIVAEDLREAANTISDSTETFMMNNVLNTKDRMLYAIAKLIKQNEYTDTEVIPISNKRKAPEAAPEPEQKDTTERIKVAGFGMPENTQKNAHETHTKTPETSKRFDNSAENKLKYLRKHKIIVSAILKTVPETKEHISNTEIKQIQSMAKNARHKSDTLIRKVYDVVCTAGYDTIKEKIN